MQDFGDDLKKRVEDGTANKNEVAQYNKLGRAFYHLSIDPYYPGLSTHEITEMSNRYGERELINWKLKMQFTMKKKMYVTLLTVFIMVLTACGQKDDWLSKQGITITDQNSFKSFTSTIYRYEKEDPSISYTLGEVEIPMDLSIEETTKDCERGYKKVILTTHMDISVSGKEGLVYYISPFDRYTGTEFFNPEQNHAYELTIEYDGKEYDITSTEGTKLDEDMMLTRIITVDCPKDYDGTVFEVGYATIEMLNEYKESELRHRIRRIDEMPFYITNGHQYYYFTVDNR